MQSLADGTQMLSAPIFIERPAWKFMASQAQVGAVRQVTSDHRNGVIRKGLQGAIYKALLSCRANTWNTLLEDRANLFQEWQFGAGSGHEVVLWPILPQPRWTYSDVFCDQWAQVATFVQSQVVMTVLKTWAIAWCTTTRYHEDPVWPCIFGCCGAPDSLVHYLSCFRFWSGVVSSCNLPECHPHADPLVKCCLVQPTPLRANLIAVASRVYHAMKFVHREVIESCINSQDFGPCLALLGELSRHFSKEIGIT